MGASNARMICQAFGWDFEKVRKSSVEDLVAIDGIGSVIAESIVSFFQKPENQDTIDDLLGIIQFEDEVMEEANMAGLHFVITGSVNHFANRNEVKQLIEARVGKVIGSVSSKTDYLINNDSASNSSKNKKAKELGIPIITEEEFIEMFQLS